MLDYASPVETSSWTIHSRQIWKHGSLQVSMFEEENACNHVSLRLDLWSLAFTVFSKQVWASAFKFGAADSTLLTSQGDWNEGGCVPPSLPGIHSVGGWLWIMTSAGPCRGRRCVCLWGYSAGYFFWGSHLAPIKMRLICPPLACIQL